MVGAALGFVTGCESCLKQRPISSAPELPYPSCTPGDAPGEVVLARGELRSGPFARDVDVYERFQVARRDGCLVAVTAHQAWDRGLTDVEVLYDAQSGQALRAWKRTALPGDPRPEAHADVRSYELRTDPIVMASRRGEGPRELREIRGGRPQIVIGPGRGLWTYWIQRADLAVGEKDRRRVLDIRALETVKEEVL